ncbi:hypothetical protein CF335_g9587, partial [Tilletia laevis]
LTREGAEASHAAALKGGGQLFRSENGTIRVEEHVEQGTKDADLITEQWISATALLEQWAQRKDRPADEVAGLVKLSATLTRWPGFSKYARAIRIWYRRHLFQWGQDGRDNKRFDLGVPNPEWWPQLKNDEDMRLKHIELQAAMDQLNSVTAAAVASTSSSAGRRGDNQQRKRPWQDDAAGSSKRQPFRASKCLVCGSRDAQHDLAHCQAKARSDGKPQLVHRLQNGTLEFKDDHRIPCINYNLGTCKNRPCHRAHRCASCGSTAHGDAHCSQQ